jgi:hypothetical protein
VESPYFGFPAFQDGPGHGEPLPGGQAGVLPFKPLLGYGPDVGEFLVVAADQASASRWSD